MPVKSRLMVLVFTDLKGTTALKAMLGDDVGSQLVARHQEIVHKLLKETDGREIDWAGDGFFLTFETPSSAVLFALKLQIAHLGEADLPGVRIGIHMGEVTERPAPEGSSKPLLVEGLAVDLASRIQTLALPGQILMSSGVFNSARQRIQGDDFEQEISWLAHGPYLFKGFEEPVEIGEAGVENQAPLRAPDDTEKASRAAFGEEEGVLGWRPARGLDIPSRPNWSLTEKIGSGVYGEAWIATQKQTGEKRVIKFCFHVDRLRSLKREVALFRLLKETLGTRSDIARIIDWQFEDSPYYLESEYTEGGNLLEWCRNRGGVQSVPMWVRLDIIAQLAESVGAAHSVGVLHKDIKPTNILIREEQKDHPQVCLTDFGIGALLDRRVLKARDLTASGFADSLLQPTGERQEGSALYMAPELLEGKNATTLSDIFALGVLFYQMAVGDLQRALAPGWERDVSDELLREDIRACVEGNPEQRLSSAFQLEERLNSLEYRRSRREEEILMERELEKANVAIEKNRAKRKIVYITAIILLMYLSSVSILAFRYYRKSKEANRASSDAESASVLFSKTVSLAKAHGRQLDSMKQAVELENYYAGIQFAVNCLHEKRYHQARQVLLELPEHNRQWEWGRLMVQIHTEAISIPNARDVNLEERSLIALAGGTRENVTEVRNLRSDRVLFTIEKPFRLARFNASSTLLALVTGDNQVEIRNLDTGRILATIGDRGARISFMDFHPDGKQLVTLDADQELILWNAASGERVFTFEREGSEKIHILGFSPDGSRILAAGSSGTVKTWSMETGEELFQLENVVEDGSDPESLRAVFNPTGNLALVFAENGSRFWMLDIERERIRETVDTEMERILTARFTDGENYLAACVRDGFPIVREGITGEKTRILPCHGQNTIRAEFIPGGWGLVTLTDAGTIYLWNIGSERESEGFLGWVREPGMLKLSPSGNLLYASNGRDPGKLWNLAARRYMIRRIEGELVNARFFSRGVLVFTLDDARCKMWVYSKRNRDSLVLSGHQAKVVDACSSPDEKLIATASRDGSAGLWDFKTGEKKHLLSGHDGPLTGISFNDDGGMAVTSSSDGTAMVWNVDTGERIAVFAGHEGAVLKARFSRDGKHVVTASSDAAARVWSLETKKELARFSYPGGSVNDACFNPDGTLVATFSGEGVIKIWNVETGSEIQTLTGDLESVISGEFHPDGTRLVTLSGDGTARLWDVILGREIFHLSKTAGPISLARFSEDGLLILTVTESGLIQVRPAAPWESGNWSERFKEWRKRRLWE